MHMADALISPAVGGTMWAATAAAIGICSKKVREHPDDHTVPLMGVLGAFIFAAQMINFTIPATGSSGHIGGGILLAILLGPPGAFLTIASVLTIQALFFADGGLLALGCNIFNLGFFPCFIAYPLIYKKITGSTITRGRILAGAVAAAVVGLQLGAFAVVMETVLSGISRLPLGRFLLLMQPIHLAIGLVEGLATAAVVIFVWQARPELLTSGQAGGTPRQRPLRWVLTGLVVAAVLTAGVASWFASSRPDGLEWALFRTAGTEEPGAPAGGIHAGLERLQERTSVLPDYGFRQPEPLAADSAEGAWPAVDAGTSTAGLVGGALVLLLAAGVGLGLRGRRRSVRS